MSQRFTARPTSLQRGVSMLEVLIAILVLAIGVLAIIGLQLVSKAGNLDGAQHSVAAQASYDLLERMRANSNQSSLQQYISLTAGGLGSGSQGSTAPTPACSANASCTPLQLVRYDLWQWEQQIESGSEQVGTGSTASKTGGLISPRACITGPADGSSGAYTVVVVWRGSMPLPNNTAVTCGDGDAAYGAAGEYRRSITIAAYITITGT